MKDHTLQDTYGLQTWVLTHLDFVSGQNTDALFLETIWLLESEFLFSFEVMTTNWKSNEISCKMILESVSYSGHNSKAGKFWIK